MKDSMKAHEAHGLPAVLKASWLCVAALCLSGCATTALESESEREARLRDRFELTMARNVERVSEAWADLARLERSLAAPTASRLGATDAESMEAERFLGRRVESMAFHGDVEEFLYVVLKGVPGWRVAPSEGSRIGVGVQVRIDQASPRLMKDVLSDAASMISGVAEIVVTPSEQSIRVRYKQ